VHCFICGTNLAGHITSNLRQSGREKCHGKLLAGNPVWGGDACSNPIELLQRLLLLSKQQLECRQPSSASLEKLLVSDWVLALSVFLSVHVLGFISVPRGVSHIWADVLIFGSGELWAN
jgi:hypothetical protein